MALISIQIMIILSFELRHVNLYKPSRVKGYLEINTLKTDSAVISLETASIMYKTLIAFQTMIILSFELRNDNLYIPLRLEG